MSSRGEKGRKKGREREGERKEKRRKRKRERERERKKEKKKKIVARIFFLFGSVTTKKVSPFLRTAAAFNAF